MTPEQYRTTVRNISATAAAQVDRLYRQFRAGHLTEAQFIDAATALLTAARQQAATIADVGLAVTLTQLTGQTVNPAGVEATEPTWLPAAFAKVLATPGDLAYQLAVIAANEPLTAEKIARSQAMTAHGSRWTRVAHAGACQACEHLTGKTLSPATTMWTHVGCTCVQQPVPSDADVRAAQVENQQRVQSFMEQLTASVAAAK